MATQTIRVKWREVTQLAELIEVDGDMDPKAITERAIAHAKRASAGADAIEAVSWESLDGQKFGGRF